ncbi:hypothetical protein [Neobacillus kokaensis]|uniref:Bacitracin ABC transporter ATP-binding protein n=1 Tax=Neobacillus kokaensis TaxID=2759023 RepID=A0ABQ3MZF9_9BACI|nr:hypothetical protein [Neobacillus kokaensis]GHH97689.1 hypothetical protein AM1BK_12320 [Neobacillus kokaensis]
MNKRNEFPTREQLDEAFHFLHDQINKISIIEDIEMMKKEKEGEDENLM